MFLEIWIFFFFFFKYINILNKAGVKEVEFKRMIIAQAFSCFLYSGKIIQPDHLH